MAKLKSGFEKISTTTYDSGVNVAKFEDKFALFAYRLRKQESSRDNIIM